MKNITQRVTNAQKRMLIKICSVAVRGAVEETGLDSGRAERIMSRHSELFNKVKVDTKGEMIRLSIDSLYQNEEISIKTHYYSGYKKPDLINVQIMKLRQAFPGLWTVDEQLSNEIEKDRAKSHVDAEGWAAIPNWKKHPQIFGNSYAQAVYKVLKKMGNVSNSYSHDLLLKINDNHVRQTVRSEIAWKKISEKQGNADILLLPIQFGLRYSGRSARRALEVMDRNEFGLGLFAVGCLLLTHPTRLCAYYDPAIKCIGDEWSQSSYFDYIHTPRLNHTFNNIKLQTRPLNSYFSTDGLATGFIC